MTSNMAQRKVDCICDKKLIVCAFHQQKREELLSKTKKVKAWLIMGFDGGIIDMVFSKKSAGQWTIKYPSISHRTVPCTITYSLKKS